MNNDRYTKSILTVIAFCLVIIVLRDLPIIPSVQAGTSPASTSIKAPNYGLIPINEDGSINVRIRNSEELDVNIKNIDTYDELRVDLYSVSTSDEVDVNIDEIGGGWISNGGPLKVKIEQ